MASILDWSASWQLPQWNCTDLFCGVIECPIHLCLFWPLRTRTQQVQCYLKMPCSPQRNRTRGAGHSVPAPAHVERHSDCSHDGIVSWAKQYLRLRILNSVLSNMLEARVDDNSQLFTPGGLGNPCCRLVNATNTDLQEHKLHLKSVLPQEGDLKCKCRSHYVKQNQSP